MKKANKKLLFLIMIIVVLVLYFKPLALSDLINQNQKISIIRIELGTKDGIAYNNSETYNDITDEQKVNIINVFQQYSYRRTFGTLISDGSLSGLGDELMQIYLYEDNVLVNTISISSTGSISVNDKSYTLKNSQELISKILEIMNE